MQQLREEMVKLLFKAHKEGEKAGKREVVEWFLTHGYSGGSIHYSDGVKARFDPPWDEWQAKLKEWNLEDE